tara:strand:+ start:1915 stop:2076 length:162 start_codon:yes stop_codon:yes gene_type:complete
MIFKKTIEIVKEVPHDADKKKWIENGWVEVVKEKPVPKQKPKSKPKKKASKKK